ncbi:MAG TPA: 3-isopropylmalate dehydrogenase [Acidobacteriota bacterium]|jgi:3-isopropylmalate dehydrogenase|nr:3-isopropylmalate dehydrogenase [Acidobacteriota bacterium]
MTKLKLLVLPGDGVGVEVIPAAIEVLKFCAQKHSVSLEITEELAGGASVRTHGVTLRESVLELARQSDAVLLGCVGGLEWDNEPLARRPERALLTLRKELGLFANLRPIYAWPALEDNSPLKSAVVRGVDILFFRELTGGIYFAQPKICENDRAVDTEMYTRPEIERIARLAFETAQRRKQKVVSVDKSNVLETSKLWRQVVSEVHGQYAGVALEHRLVDSFAMQLMTTPSIFDVVLTNNIFGDILTDEAAVIAGSLGMLPSASLGSGHALYEPVHGTAPDIAGKGIANPIGSIGCIAMLFDHTLKLPAISAEIHRAIGAALQDGHLTADLHPKEKPVSTREMTDAILKALEG